MDTWEQTRRALEDLLSDIEHGKAPAGQRRHIVVTAHVQITQNVHYHCAGAHRDDRSDRADNQP